MNQPASIDIAEVSRRVDLASVLTGYLGSPRVVAGKPLWRCPFHADDNPSLYVWGDGRKWRCWPCDLKGDVLDFICRHDGVDVIEAARRLDPTAGFKPKRRPVEPRRPDPIRVSPHDDPAWQAALDQLIILAEQELWGPAGRDALAWLNARGLKDHTIRRHRLGFVADRMVSEPLAALFDGERQRSITLPRGVVLPWPLPGTDDDEPQRGAGANVRCLGPDVRGPLQGSKCRAAQGSTRGVAYPWPEILPTQEGPPALVVEGEFDALLGCQEAGHLVHCLTVGGASQTPHPTAAAFLARCPWWLLGMDHDEAGVKAAGEWIRRAPHKARRVMLPEGKDLTDFHLAGGDVRAWLAEEMARLDVG